ncbi:adhesive protein CupB5 [Campylobacter jejuni]|nr:adhesive protein CupB5 [Campylobacter jejuni]
MHSMEIFLKDGLTTIRLMSDIDFSYLTSNGKQIAIDPVGANKYAFSGNFDGGNYTLKKYTYQCSKHRQRMEYWYFW